MEPMTDEKMRQILNQMRSTEPVAETIHRFEQTYTMVKKEYAKARAVYEKFLPDVEDFCPEFSEYIRTTAPFEKLPGESYLEAEDRAMDFHGEILEKMHLFFTRLPSILSYDQLEQCPTLKEYLKQCEMEQAV